MDPSIILKTLTGIDAAGRVFTGLGFRVAVACDLERVAVILA